jgi:formiminoglutamate deiminase
VSTYWCELAWLGGDQVADGVLVEEAGGTISAVSPGVPFPAGAVRLAGVTLPGMANAHCHAFHRALRGRTHGGAGDFWAWREQMYAVAQALDPDSYLELARATYAEMALAGITTVGEFHYLHHGPGGTPYADANAMGEALVQAAGDAGIRITLIDTCYLSGGFGRELTGVQLRFGDGDGEGWAKRASTLATGSPARRGAAIHSVRAVPEADMAVVVAWAFEQGVPLHFHLSEQPAENRDCLEATGLTPCGLLSRAGALGPRSTAVHATHLTAVDVALLGGSATGVCLCPTTERDLADGIGPGSALARAGSPLSLGTDSQTVTDLFEEARAVELDERLQTGKRGHHRPADLLGAATAVGARSLGWPEAGRLKEGAVADLVTVSLDTPRLAGTTSDTALAALVFSASAADVTDVVVSGRRVVAGGRHLLVDDVPRALGRAIARLRRLAEGRVQS